MASIEFSVVRSTLGLGVDEQGDSQTRIQLKLKYVGDTPLLNGDGEILEFENWWLLMSPSERLDTDSSDEMSLGFVRKISHKLISANVALPASDFSLLLQALLASKPIERVEFDIDDLEEIDAGLMWSSPESESLAILAIDFNIGSLQSTSDA